jgi:hypothetical protein
MLCGNFKIILYRKWLAEEFYSQPRIDDHPSGNSHRKPDLTSNEQTSQDLAHLAFWQARPVEGGWVYRAFSKCSDVADVTTLTWLLGSLYVQSETLNPSISLNWQQKAYLPSYYASVQSTPVFGQWQARFAGLIIYSRIGFPSVDASPLVQAEDTKATTSRCWVV